MTFSNPQMSTETFVKHPKQFKNGLFEFTQDLSTFVTALFCPYLVSLRPVCSILSILALWALYALVNLYPYGQASANFNDTI
jgi:hypothetical protein